MKMKMKMINRLVSAAIAACMSLTMFAGAANLDTADASKTETPARQVLLRLMALLTPSLSTLSP